MDSMDIFKTATAAPVVDPTKHVNYTYGMVLGVDDFTQEFAYHSNRDRWAARDVEGYGTLAGLRVTVEQNKAGELEVIVTAGTALNPRGELIRVPVAQCAEINRWLAVAKNREGVIERVGRPPTAPLPLYVVLCYRDCPVDSVPVPGEPCRSEEDSLAPSRLKDAFLLELRLEPPRQTEEDAVRDFVRWLAEHTEFTDEPGAFTELDDFLAQLRAAAAVEVSSPPDSSPPASPPDEYMRDDSPPDVMRVECARRGEYLRAAFRLWTTELRPRWRPAHFDEPCCCAGAKHGADKEADDDLDCLLLAELSVPLTAGLQVDAAAGAAAVAVNEERRPYLLHQRMLQEWLLDGGCCACTTQVESPPSSPPGSPPSGPIELALDDLTDVDAPAPQDGEVLTFSGGLWVPIEPPSGGGGPPTGPAGGDLTGTYPNPTVDGLRGSPVSANAPTAVGQVLTWNGTEWGPAAPPAGGGGGGASGPAAGDLFGNYPGPTVVGLRGRPISTTLPNAAGQLLTWNGAQWGPAAPLPAIRPGDAPTGDLAGTYPNPTVAGLRGRAVSNAPPSGGDVLTWNGLQWQPAPPTQPPPPPVNALRILPFITIEDNFNENENAFIFWFNIDAPGNSAEIAELSPESVRAFSETDSSANDFLDQIPVLDINQLRRNVFLCQTAPPRPALMRFTFDLEAIAVVTDGDRRSVFEYIKNNNLNFVGHDGETTATAFVISSLRLG